MTAASVILPRRYAALRLLYFTDLLLKVTVLSVVVIALDLLKAGAGREMVVVKLLPFSARGAWLVALASMPRGPSDEAARRREENNILRSGCPK